MNKLRKKGIKDGLEYLLGFSSMGSFLMSVSGIIDEPCIQYSMIGLSIASFIEGFYFSYQTIKGVINYEDSVA